MCDLILPDNHWLESWGDLEPKAGIYNTVQPAISKLFDTRQAVETFLKWSGKDVKVYDYIQKNWESNIYPKAKSGGGSFWAVFPLGGFRPGDWEFLTVGEKIVATTVRQRDVQVHRAAGLVVDGLSHEGRMDAVLQRRLAGDALEQDCLVGDPLRTAGR